MKTPSTLRALLLGASFLIAPCVQGAILYWDGGTSNIGTDGNGISAGTAGNWDTTLTNWDQGSGLAHVAWNNSNFDTAFFAGTAGTVTLTAPIVVGGLTFFGNSGYTITAGTQGLSFGATDNTIGLINQNGGTATATISGTIGGTGNVILTSINSAVASTLNLTGTSTGGWSGTTTLNAGFTLSLSGLNQGLNSTTGSITINGGNILLTNAAGTAVDNNRISSAAITANGGTLTLANTIGANVYAETIGSVALTSGQTSFTFANTQSASAGSQTLTLGGLTRTGATNTSSVLFASNSGLSATKNIMQVTGATATTAGQVIAPWVYTGNTAGAFDYAIYDASGTILSAAATLVAGGEASWTVATDAYNNNVVTQTLGATRTITALRNTAATGTLTLASGANLETRGLLNGATTLFTVAATGTGALTTPTGGGNLHINAGNGTSGGAVTISSPINNNGGNVTVVKDGLGNLTLSSTTSNYSGGTVVNAGTLTWTANTNLGSVAADRDITVNGIATLDGQDGTSLDTLAVGIGGVANFNRSAYTFATTTGTGVVNFRPTVGSDKILNLGNASGFTGTVQTQMGGLTNARPVVQFSSIADTAGSALQVGGGNGDSGQTGNFIFNGGASLTFNNRRIEIISRTSSNSTAHAILTNNSATANIWVINTDLSVLTDQNRDLRLGGTNTGNNAFNGVISNGGAGGSINVIKQDGGTWRLGGMNTFTGATTVNGGTLRLNNNLALQNSALVTTGAGFLTFESGITTPTIGGLSGATGNLATIFSSGYSSVTALTLNPLSGSVTYGGVIANGSGAMTLIKTGAGTQILSTPNTYTGATSITAGTLSINTIRNVSGGSSAIGAPTTVGNGLISMGSAATTGTLIYTGALQSTDRTIQIGTNSTTPANTDTGGAIIQADGAGNAALTFSAPIFNTQTNAASGAGANRTLTLQGSSTGANTISGTIQDNLISGSATGTANVSLTKTGTGIWVLSGANTYSGLTTVTDGTLIMAAPSSLGNGGLTVAAAKSFIYAPTSAGALNLGSGAVTLAGGAAFGTALGGTASQSAITTTGAATLTGTGTINIFGIPGVTTATGTHNLITATSGGLTGGTYTLGTVFNNTNFTVSNFTRTAGAISVDATSQTALADAYWRGNQVAGFLGTMSASTGTLSNWASDAAATATGLTPGSSTNLIFGATGSALQASVTTGLVNMSVNSITFNDSAAVTIAGNPSTAITLNSTSGTAASTLGALQTVTAGSAISVTSFANATNTISANLVLGANQTWNVASTKTLAVSGIVSGTNTLTKADTGTLTLSGANIYTGGTTISAGTLRVGNATALGANASAVSVASGGVLDLNGFTMTGTNALTLNGSGIGGTGALISAAGRYSGPITLNSASTIGNTSGTFILGSSGNNINTNGFLLTLKGAGTINITGNGWGITGGGGVTVDGLYLDLRGGGLASTNTYSGATTLINGAGIVHSGNNISLNSNIVLNGGYIDGYFNDGFTRALGTGAGQIQFIGGTSGFGTNGSASIDFSNVTGVQWGSALFSPSALQLGSATSSAGTTTFVENIDLNGATRTINAPSTIGAGAISGIISNSTGTSGLTKTGAGTLTLSNANTFNGLTLVSAGILNLSNALALQNSVIDATNSVTGDATNGLRITTATTLTLGGLSGSKNLAALFTTTTGGYNTVTGLTLNPGAAFTPSYAGVIANGAATTSLTKTGAGTQTLTGSSTYTGATSVNVGTLALGTGGNLLGSGTVGTAVSVTSTLAVAQNANGNSNAIGQVGQTTAGSVTLNAGAALNMGDGFTSTLNVVGAGTLSSGAGAATTLTFNTGASTTDLLAISGVGTNSNSTNKTLINIVPLANPTSSASTYTIITAGSGLTAANFTIGNRNVVTSGAVYRFVLDGSSSATQAVLSLSLGAGTPDTAYWQGSIDGSWKSQDGPTFATNFTYDAAGTSNTLALPGSTSSVFITANSVTNPTATLDQAFSIAGLTFTGTNTANTTGSTIASGTGGTASTLTLGTGGITVLAGSGANTISAPVILGGAQSWTNNSGNLLTVSGDIDNVNNPLTLAGSGSTTISGILGSGVTKTGGLTVNAAGATVTLSGANAHSGGTSLSAGTLVLNNGVFGTTTSSAIGTGTLTITGGTLDSTVAGITLGTNNVQAWNGDFAFTGTQSLNLGTGAITTNAARVVTVNGGTLTAGGNMTLGFNITKAGNGTLALNGTVGLTNRQLIVTGGTLSFGGTLTTTSNTGNILVGNGANASGAFVQTGGSITTFATDGSDIINVGNASSASGGFGSYTMSGGTLTAPRINLGGGDGASGTNGVGLFTVLNGATAKFTTYFIGGRNSSTNTGVATIAGGTLDLSAISGGAGLNTGAFGGGRFEANLGANLGGANSGGSVTTTTSSYGAVASGTTSQGIVNLLGGTLTTNAFNSAGAGAATGIGINQFNFNGGTLKYSSAGTNAAFFNAIAAGAAGSSGAFVRSGGATIDDSGGTITIAANLLAPTGNGVTAISTSGLTGTTYIAAPYVKITGGNSDATAVAILSGGTSGTITGFLITNPGTGYASTPTISLVGGTTAGGTNITTSVSAGNITTAANTSGSLTKIGNGTLILSGLSTYTGATTISSGVLSINSIQNAGSATANALGTPTVGANSIIGLAAASTLRYTNTGHSSNRVINLSTAAGGTFTLDASGASGTLALSGGVTTSGTSGTSTLALTGTGLGSESGSIVDGTNPNVTAVTKSGTGTWTLSGTNTYTGTTTLSVGTLIANNATTPLGASTAPLQLNGGTLDLQTIGTAYNTTVGGTVTIASNNASSAAGTTKTLGTLNIGAQTLNITTGSNATGTTAGITFGNVTQTGAAIFNVAAGTTLTLGALQSNTHNITKQNSGTLIMNSAANAARVAGSTTLTAGTLSLGSDSALGTTGTTLALNGGILDLAIDSSVNAYNTTVGGTMTIASNTATSTAGITHTLGTLSIGANTLNVVRGSNATGSTAGVTFGATIISGTSSAAVFSPDANSTLTLGTVTGTTPTITMSGAGNLVLSGAISTATALTINSGTVSMLSNNSTSAAALTIGATGVLNFNNGQIFGVLNGSGTINENGNWLYTSSASNGSFSGTINGTGGYIKQSTGTQTLSGLSSYDGSGIGSNIVTQIQNGALSINTIGNVGGGNSALGAPTTAAAGRISMGNAATTGTLIYTGAVTSTDRQIQIGTNSLTPVVGDTGGAIIQNDGTGTLTFSATNFNSATNAASGTSPTRTLTLQGTNGGTISGIIANNQIAGSPTAAVALTKAGAGTWTLSGASSYTGATIINGGTLMLDMTGSGALAATSALTLGGGNFSVKGGVTSAQTLGALTLTAATSSTITLDPNNGTSTTLTLDNAWTRGAGSSLLIDYSSSNTGTREVRTAGVTTGYGLSNGIYGGILVKDSAGVTGFATRAAGANQPITRYDDTTGTTLVDNSNAAATNFTTLNTVYTSGTLNWNNVITTRAVNSLTIDTTNNGGTINMGVATNVLTLTSGAILFKGPNNMILTGGQVGAAASEVIVNQTGAGSLTINSLISSGAGSLTKNGTGTLILGNTANAYTGATAINGGTLQISGTGRLGSGAYAGAISIANGATLQYSSSLGQTFSGAITGLGGITKDTNTSDLNLTSITNTYTGTTTVSSGRISVAAATNLSSGATSIVQSGTGQLYISAAVTLNNPFNISTTGYSEISGDTQNTLVGAIRMSGGTLGGPITLSGNSRIGSFGVTTNTISGQITGGFGIDFLGIAQGAAATAFVLSNNTNNYSGNTTIINSLYNTTATSTVTSNTLRLGASNVIPDGASAGNVAFAVSSNSNNLPNSTVILDLNGFNETINGLTVNAGTFATRITNTAAATSASILTIGANNTGSSFNGTITDSGVGRTLAITKIGNNTLSLSGPNTYIGATTVSNGTLNLTGVNGYKTTALSVASGATLGITMTGNATSAGANTSGTWTTFNSVNAAITGAGVVALNGTQFMSAGGSAGTMTTNLSSGAVLDVQTGSWAWGYSRGSALTNQGSLNVATGAEYRNSDGVFNFDALTGAGTVGNAFSGTVTLTLGVNNTTNNATYGVAGNSATFSGSIKGGGGAGVDIYTGVNTGALSLVKSGSGTQILSGTNTNTGTTVVNAGTLQFAKQVSLYNSTTTSWTAANINVKSGATFAVNVDSAGTNGFTEANLNTLLTNISVANTAAQGLQAGAILGYDTSTATGGTFTQGNIIANSTGSGAFHGAIGLTKLGTGTLILDKTNTYTGVTTISSGTLEVTGSIATSASITNNAALLFNSASVQAYANTISGSGSLAKSGVGTLTLTGGSNSYGGGTTLNAGTIAFDSGSLGNSGNITFIGNSTLQWGASNTQDLSSRLVMSNSVTSTIDTGANNVSFADAIGSSSSGALTKTGSGTLTLAGTNTYTGTTTVSTGTLAISGSGSIASSSSIQIDSSATLDVTAVTSNFTIGGTQIVAGDGSILATGKTVVANGTLSPGNSPGTLTQNDGTLQLGVNGNMNWQIHNAIGTAGTGYDTVNLINGATLDLTLLSAVNQYNVNLWSLSAISTDVNGDAINFDNTQNYAWTLLSTGTAIANFNTNLFKINDTAINGTNGFTNFLGGGAFSVGLGDSNTNLMLNFTAIPEPKAALLGALGVLLLLRRRR